MKSQGKKPTQRNKHSERRHYQSIEGVSKAVKEERVFESGLKGVEVASKTEDRSQNGTSEE